MRYTGLERVKANVRATPVKAKQHPKKVTCSAAPVACTRQPARALPTGILAEGHVWGLTILNCRSVLRATSHMCLSSPVFHMFPSSNCVEPHEREPLSSSCTRACRRARCFPAYHNAGCDRHQQQREGMSAEQVVPALDISEGDVPREICW